MKNILKKRKKNNDANEFIRNMGLGDPKTCVYHFIFDKYDNNDTNIILYFVMHRLELCINLNSVMCIIIQSQYNSTNFC